MDKIFVFSVLALLLLAGCGGETQAPAEETAPQGGAADTGEQAQAQETAVGQPAAQEPEVQFDKYSGELFSFEYPAGMEKKEKTGTTSGGDNYGLLMFANDENGIIFLYWIDYEVPYPNMESTVPLAMLQTYQYDGDPLTVLNNATNKGDTKSYILSVQGPGGKNDIMLRTVAELPFQNKIGEGDYYIYAIEYYEPELDKDVSVRIAGVTREDAEMMKENFLETFMFSNWEEILSTAEVEN